MIRLLILMACLFSTTSVFAEALGLPYGRTANVALHDPMTVEAGIQFGDVDNFGARASLKLNETTSVYGDLGMSDYEFGFNAADDTGLTFGVGGVMSLGQLSEGIDYAALGSFHYSTTDELDFTNFAGRLLASAPMLLNDVNASWYGSVGLEYINVSVDNCSGCDNDDIELAFGGGVIYPFGSGEIFGGLDYFDDLTIGGGFRIALQ